MSPINILETPDGVHAEGMMITVEEAQLLLDACKERKDALDAANAACADPKPEEPIYPRVVNFSDLVMDLLKLGASGSVSLSPNDLSRPTYVHLRDQIERVEQYAEKIRQHAEQLSNRIAKLEANAGLPQYNPLLDNAAAAGGMI